MYINESTYLRKYKCSLFLLWHVFIWLFREIKCTCDKKLISSTLKNQLRRIHVLYKEGFFFCKVDKFLPHIFLGAYKMATKMTLTYVKMTCFFHENIFFFLSFKNKAFKTHARLRSWCKHARTFKLRKCKDQIMCNVVSNFIKSYIFIL